MFKSKRNNDFMLSSSTFSSLLSNIIEYISTKDNIINIKGHIFDKNDINKQIIRLLNSNKTNNNIHGKNIYSYTTISKTPNIYLKQSVISVNAGTGVFASKKLLKGECITLYPGHYIPPKPHLISIPLDGDPPPLVDTIVNHNIDDINIIESNSYSIHCSNHGGTIDAYYGQSSAIALAHLINHPSKGIKPNVVAYDFIWDTILDKTTIQTINRIGTKAVWYIDPVTNIAHSIDPNTCNERIVGIVFIANGDIEKDQEVLFDYNYEPNVAKKLSWYSKVTY